MENNIRPIVLNLFAGPGSGKSSLSWGIGALLKLRHNINAEMAPEVAKEFTWEKRHRTLKNQSYVLGKQHHRVERLHDEEEGKSPDVIICDSPIIMNTLYAAPDAPTCYFDYARHLFHHYDNLNFFVRRVKPYQPKGRNQTKEEAIGKDQEVLDLLERENLPYIIVDGSWEGVEIATGLAVQVFLEKKAKTA